MGDKYKLFIIKKYVRATSASHALRLEKKQKADGCWVDDDWRKNNTDKLADAIGFGVTREEE